MSAPVIPVAQDRVGHPVSINIKLTRDESPTLQLLTATYFVDIVLSETIDGRDAIALAGEIALLLGIETIHVERIEPEPEA